MGFSQISLLLVAAAVFGVVAKLLKQPLIVGYLFAGLTLSVLGIVGDIEIFSGLGQVGVALLLFLVGLEMDLKDLPKVGRVALITGFGQIIFTFILGFVLSSLLGFSVLVSVYIAIALTFSSTIIIVKLLSEKKDLDSLYGKISVGFLLIQDFVAVLLLIFLSGLGKGDIGIASFLFIGLKALVLLFAVWFLSKKILPNLFEKYLAKSQELLFVSSMAWALGVASFVAGPVGFSFEIGGFLAGLALSNLPEHLYIASKTRPVRDFFLTIFFLILGTKLAVGNISEIIIPASLFSIFVLIGNPLIVMTILGRLGYKRRTFFLAGLTVAQISEFSFILMAMGASLGHVGEGHVAMIILVGVTTMTISTYLITGADRVFSVVKKYLKVFEKENTNETTLAKGQDLKDHVILVGAGRTGMHLAKYFKRKNIPFLVVDFSPDIFTFLTANNIPVLFGDINDSEIYDLARVRHARLVISTISNTKVNTSLIREVQTKRKRPFLIFTALTKNEAVEYYEKGVNKVIFPQTIAGDHIRHLLITYGLASPRVDRMGKNHFKRILRY